MKSQIAYHLNGIQFTMKFWQENAFVTSSFNEFLQHRGLILEIVLLTEKTGQAAVHIVNWTYWGALGTKVLNLESSFLQNSFQTFRRTVVQSHFLHLTPKFCDWI
jgi:hypothetical protein